MVCWVCLGVFANGCHVVSPLVLHDPMFPFAFQIQLSDEVKQEVEESPMEIAARIAQVSASVCVCTCTSHVSAVTLTPTVPIVL